MYINRLKLTNYRNFQSLDLEIDEHLNLMIAKNGSGKTNILESIYFSVFGKSFRGIESYLDFFYPGAKQTHIHIDRADLSVQDTIIFTNNGKYSKQILYLNEKTSITKIYRTYPVILFAPNSLDLVANDPRGRREDLDTYLNIFLDGYSSIFRKYYTSLKNRNNVLKAIREGRTRRSEIDFWNEKIIKEGAEIFAIRSEFFKKLDDFGQSIYSKILTHPSFLNQKFSVKYKPAIEVKTTEEYIEVIRAKFTQNEHKEIAAGTTLYGIHRDDYIFYLGDKDLRFIGSRGQQRVSAFILKVIQLIYLQKQNHTSPIFLVDDILSELDDINKNILLDIIVSLKVQTIVTTPNHFNSDYLRDFRVITLCD
jgi:DNA replication and repair protein RecF